MEEKNYTYAAFIKKAIPLFLMMLFVNVGWGQVTLPHTRTSWNTALSGWTGTNNSAYTSSFACSTDNGAKFDASAQFKTVQIDSAPDLLSFVVKSNSANSSVLLVQESDDNATFTTLISLVGTADLPTVCTTKGSYQLKTTTRYIKWTFTKGSSNMTMDDVSITKKLNSVPTVSNIQIIGLPNTTVQLAGSYDYADTENDVDASTFQWYSSDDGIGTNATAIVGATDINYTLTSTELGKYIRFGVTAAAATGTSPGTEAFSAWIGPVNAAGTPVLNAGLLGDFTPTCLNVTSDANSFSLIGNNLESDVTIAALSGFTFSATENGTYTSTLTITPASEAINTTIYVKFTPTLVQSYNGNITISGGGASAVDVSVIASGINTPVTITTGTSDALTANSATLNGIVTQGCSAIATYGMEYSIVNNFVNGAGTTVASTNENAGNFTVTLSGLQSNTTYYYKAFATDATGTVYGNQNTFTTNAIEDPTAIAATLVTQTGFTANWNAVAGASGYELDVYEMILSISPNLVQNSSFEDVALSPWSFEAGMNQTISSTQFKSGNSSLYTTVTATKNFNQEISVENNTEYTLKFSYFIDNTSTGNGFRIWTTTGADVKLPSSTTYYNTKDSWQTVEYTFTAAGTNLVLNFRLYNGVKIYFDDIEVIKSESNLIPTYVTGYPDLAVVGTSKVVTGLTPNKEYFYVVRAKDATSTSINSNEIAVKTKPTSITWNGTAWSNTTGPDETIDAIIDGNFTTTGNLTAKSLTINAGKVFTVASGHTLTVVNDLVNNAGATGLVIESDGVLLQTSTTANTAAFATVKRHSTSLFRQDYTLWSSPVVGQNLRNFSPLTLFNRFSTYNTAAGTNGAYQQEIFTTEDVDTKVFEVGKGYLIRMPNDWVQSPSAPQSFVGNFSGNLNNGDVSIPLSGANTGFNLVGNPYPSPISMAALFGDNAQINRTLYFWRKKNSANTAGSGYATVNEFGSVSTDSEINGSTLTHIKTGQGFFVQAANAAPAPLVFNNGMRANTSSIFFKSAMDTPTEAHRFWLNLADANAVVGQTLVGYATDATQGVDSGIDAVYFNDAPVALTSIINNNEYIIQGRSLPFTTNDIVPLGFKTDVAGSYTISLPNFDGLFADNQDIYLNDKATNTLHNLKSGAYTFTTQPGVFNTRFEVQYNTTLSTNNPILDVNTILIGVKNQQININAGAVTMHKIELIDVTGRVIYTKEQVNANTATIDNLAVSNQMLIVRITTAENGVVSQKIIF